MSQIMNMATAIEVPYSAEEIANALWADFSREVHAVYQMARQGNDINVQSELRRVVHAMYNQLVDNEAFREAFRNCPEPHLLKAPSWSSTLYEDQHLHVGLLSVYRGRDIPLHDHPDSYGVTLVLSGIAQIRYANVVERIYDNNLVKLEIGRSRERMPGQVCWFFEDDRNLHSIEATTATAQLLVMHFPPVAQDKQAFYFPIDNKPCTDGEYILARRVSIKRNTLKV